MAGEDRYLRGYLPWQTDVRAAPLTGVFTFCVLADDEPVEVFGVSLEGGKGRSCTAKDAGRAQVGVVLERLDEGEAEGPEGNVVGDLCGEEISLLIGVEDFGARVAVGDRHTRISYSAKENGIMVFQSLQTTFRNVPAMGFVVLATPVEMIELQGEGS